MKRWIFRLVAAFSLLLSVAIIALWIRSYHTTDTIAWRVQGPMPPYDRAKWEAVSCLRGAVSFATLEHQPDTFEDTWTSAGFFGSDGPWPVWRSEAAPNYGPKPTSIWDRLGFRHAKTEGGMFPMQTNHEFYRQEWQMPVWILLAAILSPFILWLMALLKSIRRPKAGGCVKCGYDLRATPARCPECGTIQSQSMPAEYRA